MNTRILADHLNQLRNKGTHDTPILCHNYTTARGRMAMTAYRTKDSLVILTHNDIVERLTTCTESFKREDVIEGLLRIKNPMCANDLVKICNELCLDHVRLHSDYGPRVLYTEKIIRPCVENNDKMSMGIYLVSDIDICISMDIMDQFNHFIETGNPNNIGEICRFYDLLRFDIGYSEDEIISAISEAKFNMKRLESILEVINDHRVMKEKPYDDQ